MVLRGKCPQTASNNSHCPKFRPGCIHYVRGSGVLLADEPVFTISTLQVVLRAGDGHLHRALGTPLVALRVAAGAPRPPRRGLRAAQRRGAGSQKPTRKPADLEPTGAAEAAGVSGRAGLRPCDAGWRAAPNSTKQIARAGFGSLSALPLRYLPLLRQKHPSSQVLSEASSRSFMMNRRQQPPLCLDAGSLLVAGFKSMRACCKRWLRHPLDHELLNRQPCRLKNHPLASQSLRTTEIHRFAFAQTQPPATSHPSQPTRGQREEGGRGGAATAPQRFPGLGSPRQEPAGSRGTGLLCAQREGRRFRQMPPIKIAASIAEQGEDLL